MKRLAFSNNIYKYLIIYGYLLLMIIVMLYKVPGLMDLSYYKSNNDSKKSREEYIFGGYLSDTKRFDTTKMFFPVAYSGDIKDNLEFIDSYGFERTYGGERSHEGCDIMTKENIPGQYPVVAICDGVIEKIGWLELGGYRIGLRSESGVYYYYAHLHSYEDGVNEGDKVIAGQVIGYIGDTGYSKVEGTTGNFDVHLHFGIYLNGSEEEYTVNPYYLLKKLENSTIKYGFKK